MSDCKANKTIFSLYLSMCHIDSYLLLLAFNLVETAI